jgi:transcriptional regulator with XRE-family HTH domain
MAARPDITQMQIAREIGHDQTWVSRFKRGIQNADVDELQAMAHMFGHTLNELFDLRPDPQESALVDAFRALEPSNRTLAVEMLKALIPPPRRAPARKRNGER